MRVLVTGASGFVGRHVVAELVRRSAKVHVTSRSNIEHLPQVTKHRCDIFNASDIKRLIAHVQPEAVLHLAWFVEPGKFWNDDSNVRWKEATIELIRASQSVGVHRFVGVGTCAEYGRQDQGCYEEAATIIQPSSLYAKSKNAVRESLELSGFPSFCWARLFHIYGPHEKKDRLVPSLCLNLIGNRTVRILASNLERDFMDVRDVGVALAMLTLGAIGGAVNICSGEGTFIGDIGVRLARLAGRESLLEFSSVSADKEAPSLVGCNRRLSKEVGFRPNFNIEQSLADCYEWWRKHP